MVIDNRIFDDNDILNAIKHLNEIKRPAQLSTILTELHDQNLYTSIMNYESLFEKLCAMRSRGLLIWDSENKKLGQQEEVRIVLCKKIWH